ncbi:unnamed protein product, partial [marine sediment metagenome]
STAVVEDNSGSNFTADGYSISSIGDTSIAWAVDGYAGYWVEIVSGASGTTGEKRTIQGNTADTITPTRNFTADPGDGATFRIVEPDTVIEDTSNNGALQIESFGRGDVWLSRLKLERKGYLLTYPGDGFTNTYLAGVIFDMEAGAGLAHWAYNQGNLYYYYRYRDPITYSYGSDAEYMTVSHMHATAGVKTYTVLGGINWYGVVCKSQPDFNNSLIGIMGNGSRFFKGCLFDNSTVKTYITNGADFATTLFTNAA